MNDRDANSALGEFDHKGIAPALPKSLHISLFSLAALCLGILALIGLAQVLATKLNLASPLTIDILAASFNIAVFAMLFVWSITRFGAEHGALGEASIAMELAPMMLTSLDGKILLWSRGCEELYGWTAEQALGRHKDEVLRTQDAPVAHVLRKVGNTEDQQREVIEQCRDGTTVHVVQRVRLVEAERGGAVLVYKMTDISARVRIEAKLKESDANLSLALDAHQIGTFNWDVVTRKVTVSPGVEQRLGFQPGDLSSFSKWARRVHPADLKAFRAVIAASAVQRSERYDFQYRINVPHGGVRSLEGSGRLIYDATGRLVEVVGVHIDVSDRIAREAALREAEEQFRLVLRCVPSAMVIFDELGVIKAFSDSAGHLFGYSAKEVLGCNVDILAIGSEVHGVNSIVDRYLATGKSQVTDPTAVTFARRRDGSLVPIEVWIGDMHIGTKRLFTAFARNYTGRLESEKRLSEMRDELLHASRLSTMGEMAAGLAHELNQPLAATVYFLGAADLILADATSSEQGRALLRLGVEQSLRAGEILRRMREFATRESIDMQVGQIDEIIEDAVSLAFLGESRHGIKLIYDLDRDAETVLADRVQIAQVFVNLLRNATEELRKCSPTGRWIAIRTRALGPEMMEVTVADSGPGLAPHMLEQVYLPFTSTKREQGMGLGLSICRRIIEAHGGSFSAANADGGGAVFCFTLSTILATAEPTA